MYRPKNWYTNRKKWAEENNVLYINEYEAGADAMLRVLMESVDTIKVEKNQRSDTPSMMVGGKWVFIPGENDEEN